MSRFATPGTNPRSRFPNRPTAGREALALLGFERDIDPDLLLIADDDAAAPWTLVGGAGLEATGAFRGVEYHAANLVRLDAVGESAQATFLGGDGGLPVATYLLRLRIVSDLVVADEVGIAIRNVTDATLILPEVLRASVAKGVLEVLFTVKVADMFDTLRLEVTKRTGTANAVRIDYAAIHPADAVLDAFGKVPRGGRIEYAYGADGVSSHTIYDAAAGGNVIETAAYGYTSGDLTSVAYTRGPRTLTKTFTYTSGDLTKTTLTVS